MKYGILLIIPVFLACKSGKESNTSKNAAYPIAVEENHNPNDSLFIRFEKTPCFGFCPTYTAHIYKSGFALLNAKKNVDFTGIYRVWFSPDEMKEIETKLKALDFFSLENEYDGRVTDLPSTLLKVSYLGQEKEVKARYQIPEELSTFNHYLHEQIMSKEWENTSAPKDEK